MQATTIGLDIAKSVFQVHGVDAEGQVVIRRQLKRRYVLAFFEKLAPCLVGIEVCASSHHWARQLQALGHTVRLMPPAYPYVSSLAPVIEQTAALWPDVRRARPSLFKLVHMGYREKLSLRKRIATKCRLGGTEWGISFLGRTVRHRFDAQRLPPKKAARMGTKAKPLAVYSPCWRLCCLCLLGLPQQLWQLGDIRRDPPRLIIPAE